MQEKRPRLMETPNYTEETTEAIKHISPILSRHVCAAVSNLRTIRMTRIQGTHCHKEAWQRALNTRHCAALVHLFPRPACSACVDAQRQAKEKLWLWWL